MTLIFMAVTVLLRGKPVGLTTSGGYGYSW